MTTRTGETPLRERAVGEIAATTPGATAVFRKFRLDFCCGGDQALESAARERGVDPDAVEQALRALMAGPASGAPATAMSSEELIRHIENDYHAAHRRALPELVALSRRVEAVHRENPKAPAGLADTLQEMETKLEQHMAREEARLFPAMRQQQGAGLGVDIQEMLHQHDDQRVLIHRLESLTDNFTLPGGACRSWQALYVGTSQLVEDLMEHIHLENNVLFPRYAGGAAAGHA